MAKPIAWCVLFLTSCWIASAQTRPGGFTVLGPGGGGAMFHPTISPHDPTTVLVACDMTGAYITHDGGGTWRMFNLRGVVRFFVFDPADPKTIYAATHGLWRSTDGGETWSLVYPQPSAIQGIRMNPDHADETFVADPDPLGSISSLAIDPDNHRTVFVTASRNKSSALFLSQDAGNTWQQLNPLPEAPQRMWIDPRSNRNSRTLFMAGSHFIVVRDGSNLVERATPAELTNLSMGFDQRGKTLIYATAREGLYASRDEGASWQKLKLPGSEYQVRAVATSLDHPDIAYVSYNHLVESGHWLTQLTGHSPQWMGVAKTTDGGKSWQLVRKESNRTAENVHDAWISERFGPGWPENPLQLGVADQDPNLAYGTDYGRTMKTTDGGATWTAVYSRRVPGAQWTSTGLDVTTNYGIHFDPFDRNRQFITFTDIGLVRSQDGGRSWQSATNGVPQEWLNTTYWVVFDPKVRGRMWSVNSENHDLPRPKMWRHNSVLTYKGGVCRSDDGGSTWAKSSNGMEQTAPTHILLDASSPVDARVLYVAAFGRGVYKSTDDGRTWGLKNQGIAQPQPMAWRLTQDSSGTLYVILARRSEDGSIGNDGDGAIYRSRDSAENWEPVSLPNGSNGPNGLAVDPRDPQRLYLAAWARATGLHGEGGGIFLSRDGGKSWRQVLNRDQHVYDVTIDPRNPNWLYAAGFESSAWRSVDRGEHWTRIPGFNFKWGHRVIADPADPNSVYITTFGGSVWHGNAHGKPGVLDIRTPEMEPD
jgi:photosystem II stability/assembly factor-like uncharacterized protein